MKAPTWIWFIPIFVTSYFFLNTIRLDSRPTSKTLRVAEFRTTNCYWLLEDIGQVEWNRLKTSLWIPYFVIQVVQQWLERWTRIDTIGNCWQSLIIHCRFLPVAWRRTSLVDFDGKSLNFARSITNKRKNEEQVRFIAIRWNLSQELLINLPRQHRNRSDIGRLMLPNNSHEYYKISLFSPWLSIVQTWDASLI